VIGATGGIHLTLGARQLLTFLRSKSGAKGYCWWKQETIARDMERGLRTVNRQVSELVSAGYLKSERHGHGNHYILCDLAEKVAYRTASVGRPVESPAVGVSDTPNRRIAPEPVSISEILEPENAEEQQHCSTLVGSSPAANNVAASKPSPEREKPNPKPASGGNPSPAFDTGPAFDTEVAEIRAALKARPLVRWTPAFDRVIREMLGGGETVETIERAIVRGCWLKLASHDQASRRGLHDESMIFSMRYFQGVIADAKAMSTEPR
jgi:hypothetical protein